MLQTTTPAKAKLIIGFIYKDNKYFLESAALLKKKFGAIDYTSKEINFNFTDYYAKEMGQNLKRKFISFKRLIKPGKLANIKLFCIGIEKKLARGNKRMINIDPGYLNQSRLILASTKDFSHRIYLKKGAYAEITLIYTKKRFKDLEWTFPDYRTEVYKSILNEIRRIYTSQLNERKQHNRTTS